MKQSIQHLLLLAFVLHLETPPLAFEVHTNYVLDSLPVKNCGRVFRRGVGTVKVLPLYGLCAHTTLPQLMDLCAVFLKET